MELLLRELRRLPGFDTVLKLTEQADAVAVTGLGQINRSHVIAGLYALGSRPLAVVCQDDMAAKRLAEELKAFLGVQVPVLPSRDNSSP